jgi:hypothetical protein
MQTIEKYAPVVIVTFALVWAMRNVVLLTTPTGNSTGF